MSDVKISITLKEDGNVDFVGPLHDKILCFGILEVAKNLVAAYQPSPIIKPTNGDVKMIKS